MRAVRIALIAMCVAGPAHALAQPSQTFRAGVDLVRLDVRVTDADGRPVKDIRQDEVRITEGDVERPVVFFQHVDEPTGDYVDIARRTIGSEVSTNRGAPRGHLYVLVFDQQHIAAGREQRARRAAELFLRSRVRRGDRVALYGLPGPGPRLGFTADVDRVIGALAGVRGMLEQEAAGRLGVMRPHEAYEIVRGNERVLARVSTRMASEGGASDVTGLGATRGARGTLGENIVTPRLVLEDARAIVATLDGASRQSLAGLEALMEDLRPVEGRKAIVLISEGFHADNLARELDRVAAVAARAYGVIYAVDIGSRTETTTNTQPAEDTASEVASRLEPLGSLAAETDGRLFADANGWTDSVMAQVADESQAYYLVGFAPAAAARRDPTQYRRIAVTVTRPGTRVSTRTGYAVGATPPSPADRRRAIDLALAAPFPLQEVPLRFTTYTLRADSSPRQRVVMTLEAELPPASGNSADLVFAVRHAADGRLAASGSDRLAGRGTDDADQLIRYRVQFELDPGDYLMRVVVRNAGGLIGSADRRFRVRPLLSRDLTVSDLVFSTPDGALAVRPYGYQGESLSGVLELYGGTRAELDRAEVIVDLLRFDRSSVRSVVADMLPIKDGTMGAVRPVQVDIPLQGVPPGEYIARARLRDGNDIAGEVSRDVEVIAAPATRAGLATSLVMRLEPHAILESEVGRRARAGADARPAAATAFARGALTFAAGDYPSAVAAWAQTADAAPGVAPIRFVLGWAHAGAGDRAAAISAWRQAVHIEPTLLSAHLAIVDAFVAQGERALAEQAVRAALAVMPASRELHDRLAQVSRR